MSLGRILASALIAGSLQLLSIGPAAADVPKGAYLGADAGGSWTSNLTYVSTYNNCGIYPYYYCGYSAYNAVTYNIGYAAGVQIGYAFGGPRLEFEVGYRNNPANTIATPDGTQSANGDLNAKDYMINVLYDFDTGTKWVPYIGLGLGAATIQANNITNSTAVPRGAFLNGTSTDFAAQFIFGVEFLATDKLGVFLDWRGLWANNATFNYGYGCTNSNNSACAQTGATTYSYWNGALNLGLHWHF